jgi:hypothetical protein
MVWALCTAVFEEQVEHWDAQLVQLCLYEKEERLRDPDH